MLGDILKESNRKLIESDLVVRQLSILADRFPLFKQPVRDNLPFFGAFSFPAAIRRGDLSDPAFFGS